MASAKKPLDADRTRSRSPVRVGAALAAVLAAALLAWVLFGGGDDGETNADSDASAQIVSVEELESTAADSQSPIYWVGPRNGTEFELSHPAAGQTLVRYIDGDFRGLTVGTYEFADPVTALREKGDQEGGVLATAPGNATVYFETANPQSIYLAFPDQDLQIEVFDTEPARALKLVTSGQVVPVG